MDIESLVAPLSEDEPSGPDLSYDSERQQIESVFERQAGGSDEDDEAPDWRGAIELIKAQAKRTRDLWLPTYLMRAAAQIGDFELLVEATEWFARLIEERWLDVHPQLDEYGFIGRKTPCASLTTIGDFLLPLGKVPLLTHPRLGKFSGVDFDKFRVQGSSADDYGRFRAVIEATDVSELQLIVDRFDLLRGAIGRADAILTANAESDTATNFAPTYEQIDKIRRAVAEFVPGTANASEGVQTDTSRSVQSTPQTPNSGPDFSGGINSRDDAVRALAAIGEYFLRHEPSSPVPVLLRRAKEWISLDFLAILEDIAPGSVDEANRVLKSGRITYGSSDSQRPLPSGPGEEESGSGSASNSW